MQYFRTLFCFLLLITALLVNATAQNNDSFVWAPVGATWHYSGPKCHQAVGRGCDYYTINSVKDTVFKGENARILEWRDENNKLKNREIMMNKRDSVFYYDNFQDQYQLIFDFDVKAGDTLVLSNDTFSISNSFIYGPENFEIPRFRILIDSVKRIKTNNGKRKKIYTTPLDGWSFKDELIDNIGGMQFFFGYYTTTTDGSFINGGFRCYQDSSTTFKLFKDSCNYIYGSSGIIDNSNYQANLKISPLPFNDQVIIKLPNNLSPRFRITIWNTKGKIVKEKTIYKNKYRLELSNLSSGVYLLKVKTKNKVLTEKILKK